MDEFRVSHLPIVNNEEFLGLISENDILDMNNPEEPIGNHKLSLLRPIVLEDQHVYEVFKVFSSLKLSIIPVLSANNKYLGIITLSHLLDKIANMASFSEPGGLIVLELNVNDYYLSEITKIIEDNDAKILSLYVSSAADSTKLEVTIKVNRTDVSSILSAFSRYGYNVVASIHQSEFSDDVKNRYDSLMNYLNM